MNLPEGKLESNGTVVTLNGKFVSCLVYPGNTFTEDQIRSYGALFAHSPELFDLVKKVAGIETYYEDFLKSGGLREKARELINLIVAECEVKT